MAFERRQPSVDLRAFLDPLKPGEYFDCGGARLYGIDEALEAEALRRGRAVGDDRFQLVATDGGLIFCRASIMFAIAARWKDLTIGRPEAGTQAGEAILPISWPTHGDLRFTVSRRLGSNIFRRWLQLQAQATRRSQVEQDVRIERTTSSGAAQANGHSNGGFNGHGVSEPPVEHPQDRNGFGPPVDGEAAADAEAIDLRASAEPDRSRSDGEIGSTPAVGRPVPTVDPLATIDAAVVDEWVDDRVPHTTDPRQTPPPGPEGLESTIFEDDATADPFNGHELGVDGGSRPGGAGVDGAASPTRHHVVDDHVADDPGPEDDPGGEAIRFEARPTTRSPGASTEAGDQDATATQFMRRTVDGTDIFPGGGTDRDVAGFGRSVDRGDRRGSSGSAVERRRKGHLAVPVPEISGARLHGANPVESEPGPRLDIRSTLLAGRRESEWVEMLRQRQVLILGIVTIVALGLIALIGFLSGGGGDRNAAVADTGAQAEANAIPPGAVATDEESVGSSTTGVSLSNGAADTATIDSTAPTLRVSSTSVQICHSNYGGCVPVAADVDCEGDGDGPAFQATPVAVFGDDVYDLDTDDDREACEPDQPRLDASGRDG